MGDVVRIPNLITTLDLEPDHVLKAAEGQLEEVLILGWKKAEKFPGEFYMAFSEGGLENALVLILRAQKEIVDELP